MPLPDPQLDDRRFQDLVNEAKMLIPRYTPEWTDHNVSDPGVTLIELFAWMTDLMLFRLNRVPEKSYLRFMDLLGITLKDAVRRPSCDIAIVRRRSRAPSLSRAAPTYRRCRRATSPPSPYDDHDLAIVAAHDAAMPVSSDDVNIRGLYGPAGTRWRVLRRVPARPLPATRSTSASPKTSATTCFNSRSIATWRASASTRATRRWRGRPGAATRVDGSGAWSSSTNRG